ncbi:GNAT family N-acetyltransferase [Paenibacillus sp. 1P07SE]|uniref:GNAT family N-acetyltransferase n=1 Tax=Paenibacillus sp. 1P07SE TaxID=3132209 RepID=UPI0039A74B6D
MIIFRKLSVHDAIQLGDIDRSEYIELIYRMEDNQLVEDKEDPHECPSWTEDMLDELKERFVDELANGGTAYGAFDQDTLVGFGVLAHKFRGDCKDQLQIDLMYVSRAYRRKGIGTRILDELSNEARKKGAKSLYISSTETQSAVSFYRNNGSRITQQVDEELFEKEPLDIHMEKQL